MNEHMEQHLADLDAIFQPQPQSESSHQLGDTELSIYPDGNVAKINLGASEYSKRCRKIVSATDASSKRARAGKRQKVRGFSKGSRMNLKRKFAELSSNIDSVYHVTLTLPDSILAAYSSQEKLIDHARKSLDRFFDSLQYRYPLLGCIWHVEFGCRNSGKYKGTPVPHFHLLLHIPKDGITRTPSLTRLGILRQQIAKLWNKAVRTDDPDHLAAGTQVKPVCWRRDRVQLTKYLSKSADGEDTLCVGRRWGIRGKKNLLWDEEIRLPLTRGQGLRLWSFFRTFLGIPCDAHWRLPSLTVFIDSGWLLDNLQRLVT